MGAVTEIPGTLPLIIQTYNNCFVCSTAAQFFGPKETYTDLVQTLINAGCNLNLADKSGYTPLYQAAFGGECGKSECTP